MNKEYKHPHLKVPEGGNGAYCPMEPENNPFSLGTPEVPGYKIVNVSTAESDKKDVWAEFEKLFEDESVVKLQVGIFKSDVQINTNALKSFIKTHFIPRAEVVEMVKWMPYSHTKEGGVYISRDDLLDLLTQ